MRLRFFIIGLFVSVMGVSSANACQFMNKRGTMVGYTTGNNIASLSNGFVGYISGNLVMSVTKGYVGFISGATVSGPKGMVGYTSGNAIFSNTSGHLGYGFGNDCTPSNMGAALLLLL